MATDILVPTLGESVSSATVARWLKQAGEAVAADEPLVELETDKVTVEVPAPAAGVLEAIAFQAGAEVEPGAVLGSIGVGAGAPAAKPAATTITAGAKPVGTGGGSLAQAEAHGSAPGGHAPMPAAAKLMAENNITPAQIGVGSAKDGRIAKGDVLDFLSRPAAAPAAAAGPKPARALEAGEERVKMTRLRVTIARRLKEAQNTAAMLTTFNEVDMGAVMALRSEYKDHFEKRHGAKLGFMSFFVKACVAALQEFPAVNAEIEGDEIIYKNFVHMGIAVGGPNGLVVPVLKNADGMGFAEIETRIADFGKRVRDGQLKLEEMAGGSFTITNGGIYGSLMSTPILNPPQSGILGMHKIQDRPMAMGKSIEIRPMMYLALSYDHRIVDGKEAVSFLVRVKEAIEDPRRLMLGV
jgi:2-oxoglutarate dehydrogenase E2 component (dihydrolipoamide succinyltransferase)